ncbi:MAG: DUF3515 family protein [Mobilicoccus sp.]|nr:DUF3515 family protein [Mobilicoccus sp.]
MPRRTSSFAVAGGVGVAVLSVLSACTASVEVAPGPDADAPPCQEVAGAWPVTVEGMEFTSTTPEAPSIAAWADGGDPAIIARCGVPVPGPTTIECIEVDGVDWLAESLDDGMRFTTYGREVAVELLVPDAYAPEPLVLTAFAEVGAIAPRSGPGCT